MSKQSLKPKQRIALAALLESGHVNAAAAEADVSRDTLYRWLKDPLFRQALRDAEADALRALSRQLVALGTRATAVIDDTMSDPNANASTRLRAADIVLARLLQLRELATLEDRVTALEQQMERER